MQIWDFNLGRLRDHEESEPLEDAYGSNDAGFMLKNFGELLKETSLTSSTILGDIYQINCSMGHDDITFNVSSSCCSMYLSDFFPIIYLFTFCNNCVWILDLVPLIYLSVLFPENPFQKKGVCDKDFVFTKK